MSNKNNMAKDTIIYIIAKMIEGLVGVITISAMSYIYLPEQIGKYSTINIFITTVAMVLIQWLVQSTLRYVNKYDIENEQDKFFSTVFFSWFKVNVIMLFISSFVVVIISLGAFEHLGYSFSLIFTAIGMFFTYNTAQLVIALLASARKTKTNLVLSTINVVGKLLSIIILNYAIGVKIEWIFLSYIIFDFFVCIIGMSRLNIIKHINIKYYDKEILKILKVYGIPLMGNMIATSVLNKSDIYIITGYIGRDKAGIYQTNYSIIASAFTLLSAGVMRGSYPTIIRVWSKGETEHTKTLIQHAIKTYLMLSIPAVIGVFCLSESIATVLFDSVYVKGHSIMGYVALGMMFLGLTEYAIKPWELMAQTKEIFKRSMISGAMNILLNLIFIKQFGYEFASISTFLSFLLYFLLAVYGTRRNIKFSINVASIIKIVISGAIMGMIVISIKEFMVINILTLIFIVILGIISYTIMLYVTGEIKNEINYLLNKIKDKVKNKR